MVKAFRTPATLVCVRKSARQHQPTLAWSSSTVTALAIVAQKENCQATIARQWCSGVGKCCFSENGEEKVVARNFEDSIFGKIGCSGLTVAGGTNNNFWSSKWTHFSIQQQILSDAASFYKSHSTLPPRFSWQRSASRLNIDCRYYIAAKNGPECVWRISQQSIHSNWTKREIAVTEQKLTAFSVDRILLE